MLDIKTDENLLFNYRNIEINSHNQYCYSNKKRARIEFENHLDSEKKNHKQFEFPHFYKNTNNNSMRNDKDNLNVKKIRSEIIKRENENLLKKYEIYKNSDFEEYEKKYLLEKSENKTNYKEDGSRIDKEKGLNQFNFSSDNPKKLYLRKITLETGIKIEDKITHESHLENQNDFSKLNKNEAVNLSNSINKCKIDKETEILKELKIDFNDLKIREEKYISLKQKLDQIKNSQKELVKKITDKDSINEDNKRNTNQQINFDDKLLIKAKNGKTRSLSSKVSPDKQALVKSEATQFQNSNNKNGNNLQVSIEKQLQNLRKSRDSETSVVSRENKNMDINPKPKNYNKFQQNNNIVSTRSKKENISKEFKQVLNDLKIDNILQKTKMIFKKQLTLNSSLQNNRDKTIKEFDLKNIKISPKMYLVDEKEKEDLRNSVENFNKKPKSDNILNDLLNPELKKNLKENSINNNRADNNNQTSTIIINNNININTFIDKGDLIYPDKMDNYKHHEDNQNKAMKNNSNRNYHMPSDENYKENFVLLSKDYKIYEPNNLRNSSDKYDKDTKQNRKKLISNLNTNSKWELKESSINKKIPSSTKDIKREYSDNNYKNLLLCSYESGITNSKFNLEPKQNYYNKDYERVKDYLKKYESVEKYPIEKQKILKDDYSYYFNKNRNLRNNYEKLDYRNSNISPSYLLKNHKRINRPFSHVGSIDFDNKTNEIDYLFYNEKEKNKPALKFPNNCDNAIGLNKINY